MSTQFGPILMWESEVGQFVNGLTVGAQRTLEASEEQQQRCKF